MWVSEGPKDSAQGQAGWGVVQTEKGVKQKKETVPFLGESPEVPVGEGEEEEDEEEDESQAYRQPYKFRLSSQSEPAKPYPGESHWTLDSQEDGGRYKSKVLKAGVEGGGGCQFKGPGYVLKRPGKDRHPDEGKGAERREHQAAGTRETPTTSWHVKAGSLKELVTQGPLLQKVVDVRDRAPVRNQSPPGTRPALGEAHRPEVRIKMAAKSFEEVG